MNVFHCVVYRMQNRPVTGAPGPVIITTVVPVGPTPVHTVCPHCYTQIDTSIKSTPSQKAWISGILLFLCGYIRPLKFIFKSLKPKF